MAFNNVGSFLEQLGKMAPAKYNTNRGERVQQNKVVEKLFLNNPATLGRYQILPMNSVITDYPYVRLSGVREISVPKQNIHADGTMTPYGAWIRLLPKDAYKMKEPSSGAVISSLTAQDEALLDQAYTLFDKLYEELDARNNYQVEEISGLIRKKNYVLFHGYCTNYWKTSRTIDRQNFAALFIVTAADFINAVEQNIDDVAVMKNADDWITEIYNRQQSGRSGSLMVNIQRKTNEPGFSVSVNHLLDQEQVLTSAVITDEQAAQMSNPVETFLGYQAPMVTTETPAPEYRNLFNPRQVQQAIDFMTKMIAAVQMAKSNSQDINAAIKATNELIRNSQAPTNTRGVETNDPLLAQQAQQAMQRQDYGMNMAVNTQSVQEKNTDPYSTPPAAHIDPITGQPVAPGSNNFNRGGGFGQQPEEKKAEAPFAKPEGLGNMFAQPGNGAGGNGNFDLPF